MDSSGVALPDLAEAVEVQETGQNEGFLVESEQAQQGMVAPANRGDLPALRATGFDVERIQELLVTLCFHLWRLAAKQVEGDRGLCRTDGEVTGHRETASPGAEHQVGEVRVGRRTVAYVVEYCFAVAGHEQQQRAALKHGGLTKSVAAPHHQDVEVRFDERPGELQFQAVDALEVADADAVQSDRNPPQGGGATARPGCGRFASSIGHGFT